MLKVFISYARDQSHGENLAMECQHELQGAGFDVFRDVIGLKPGDVWYSKLELDRTYALMQHPFNGSA